MAIRVILEVQVKQGSEAAAMKYFRDALPDTRSYAGCRHIDMAENTEKPGNLLLVEEWDSRPHYEKYLAWRTETGFVATLGGMLAGPPSIRYFELVDG